MKLPDLCFLFFTAALFLASCASSVKPQAVSRPPKEIPPPDPVDPLDPIEFDQVFQMAENNSPGIRKFFTQDENRNIHVKGEPAPETFTGKYEITYDLTDAYLPEYEQLRVFFTVKEKTSGAVKHGSFIWNISEGNAGILLSFDDNYEEVWETWFDKLDEYGAKATFFIHAYSPFCKTAAARGHEIGYHSRNHLNLPKVGREIFDTETLEGLDEFLKEEIPLRAFAYPFGLWEPWMNEKLSAHFSALRGYGVSYRLYGIDGVGGTFTSSTAIDNTLYKDDGVFIKTITLMLRAAKFLDGVLPLTTHTVSADADWGIKAERLEYLLKTGRDLKMNFYRYSDFYE